MTAVEKTVEEVLRRVLADYEIHVSVQPGRGEGGKIIAGPEDALVYLEDIRHAYQEQFVCITLDGSGKVIKRRIVFKGTLTESIVHPREIFVDAIADRAAKIIVAHNHPSGSLEPSHNDCMVTKRIKEAGEIIGIELLDHIIVTSSSYRSIINDEIGNR
jgi:DNA repair protein RadC